MTELPEPKQFGDYGEWPGRAVLDADGERIGEVREIYLDDATDRPEWVLVERADREPRFVPLANARVENESIRVAQPADRIDAAPGLEPTKQLTLDQERDLYAHYAVELSDEGSASILPAGAVEETTEQPAAEEPAAAEETPAAGVDEPTIADPEPPSLAAPAVTGAGTWSAAAAAGEPETVEPAAEAGEPEADEPAAEIGESEAGGLEAPEAGVAAAAGLAGGADVIQGTEPVVPPAPEDAPMLPPAGETSEPEDRGPMVPPRPEPVAPPPPPPPSSGGPIEVVKKKPVPIAAGGILALLVILFIIRRRS